MPWVEEQADVRGGVFQLDGSILMDPGFVADVWPVLDSDGELRANVQSGRFPAILSVAEGTKTLSIATGGDRCPYNSVHIGDPDGTTVVSSEPNGFARVAIVEPNVAVAFPHFPDADGCEDTASTVARVWDLETAEPLEDHPLDGMEVARAALSADGSRMLILDAAGSVRVLDRDSGEVIAQLNDSAEAAQTLAPLALNSDGTIAAVAEDNGLLSVWHVGSAELLFSIESGTRSRTDSAVFEGSGPAAWSGLRYLSAASLSYDARRVAVLDQGESEAGVLRILTLDPNDWLQLACESGFSIGIEERTAQGLDDSIPC